MKIQRQNTVTSTGVGLKRALVIGAGVGGLVAANAFAARGVEVVVVERRAAFDSASLGLGQPANALRVYRRLGVLDEILEAGFRYDSMLLADADRERCVTHEFLLGDSATPAFCALARSELHAILHRRALGSGVQVRLGTTVESLEDDGRQVTATFSNGRTDSFDLVAGFDGIRSNTRQLLFGTAFEPRALGYGAWRVKAPRPDYVRSMEFLHAVGSKTGAIPLSRDSLYLFHIRAEDPGAWFRPERLRPDLRERLAGYGGYVGVVRDSLGVGDEIVYSPLERLLVPPPWHCGRIVIGGDAAHVVPPHLTQGAAMAAEDGFLLAELTTRDAPLEQSLAAYGRRRWRRAAFVYSFGLDWLAREQATRSPADLDQAMAELAVNATTRIGASDRVLNEWILDEEDDEGGDACPSS